MARRKRANGIYRVLFISVVVLCLVAAGAYYINQRAFRHDFVHYNGFGIDIPVKYPIHGIDVSRHQANIFWPAVCDMTVKDVSLGFTFIKATEGVESMDPQFRRNWLQARKYGITKGAYHFFIASKSGKQQAVNFIRNVPLLPGDLPPVLDIEQTNGVPIADLQQRVADWLDAAEKKYGVKPIIYTYVDFYQHYLQGRFDDYPLWVAHYLVKDKPRISRDWVFWQHSESGHVDGIDGRVDFNVFNGDSTAFEALKIKAVQ